MYSQKYSPSFNEVVNKLWNMDLFCHMRYMKYMNKPYACLRESFLLLLSMPNTEAMSMSNRITILVSFELKRSLKVSGFFFMVLLLLILSFSCTVLLYSFFHHIFIITVTIRINSWTWNRMRLMNSR